jgi:cobalamin biosynthesis protein CobT
MNAKRPTTHRRIQCLLALALLVFISSSKADNSSKKKKNILLKFLGRFKKQTHDNNIVIKEKSADVVAQSVDADDVCTSNGQVCSVKSEKEEGTDIADASQNTADMQHQDRIEPHEIDTATSKTADQNDAATKENPENEAAENDNTSNTDSINAESEQPTNESPREEITCNDLHENCSTWASQIDPQTNLTPCTTHLAYMSIYCPVSCDTCILVEIDATLREISKSL